jgi:hypothetical protein
MIHLRRYWPVITVVFALGAQGCVDGGGDGGTEADKLGVGAACVADEECDEKGALGPDGEPIVLACLQDYKGGYCGLKGCSANDECPESSVCVSMEDGENYCFRRCLDKAECNANRPEEVWANCSSNVTFVEEDTEGKACVPPTGSE